MQPPPACSAEQLLALEEELRAARERQKNAVRNAARIFPRVFLPVARPPHVIICPAQNAAAAQAMVAQENEVPLPTPLPPLAHAPALLPSNPCTSPTSPTSPTLHLQTKQRKLQQELDAREAERSGMITRARSNATAA